MSEKAAKPYPEDLIEPKDLPDTLPAEHPTPWKIFSAGNGHFYIEDANNVTIAHVFCWEREDFQEFKNKINLICGTDKAIWT